MESDVSASQAESGPRAGYDGAKRKRGSKLHMAVDTLGHLLALHVTPANVDDRAEVDKLAARKTVRPFVPWLKRLLTAMCDNLREVSVGVIHEIGTGRLDARSRIAPSRKRLDDTSEQLVAPKRVDL